MSTETKHTPLPLTAYNSYVRDADGNILLRIECNGEPEKERQQAAFIVRACNAHYDLVEALQGALIWVKAIANKEGPDSMAAFYAKSLQAALTKAKGQL